MTVSANPTPDLQRDQIIAAALELAGMKTAGADLDPDLVNQAALHLSLALIELQTEGIQLTSLVRETETLVADTEEYALDTDTLDIRVDGDSVAGMTVDTNGVESPVLAISSHEYQRIGDKTATADRPTKVYIDKSANSVTLVFWPIPSDSTMVFRYTRVRFLRDLDTGDRTLELKRIYLPWLTYMVASGVAASNSKGGLADKYRLWASNLLPKAQSTDRESVTVRIIPSNSGVNWR
jgi:hypothetical protein